ncbi:MAG TPA: DUF2188 domain-containing protein [Candidatus Saccharimonadales bacterium]|nr:DUF2188 domain-containing protein [Candidatus Saccharimonadales bacterium]
MANYHVSKNKDIDKWGARREGADRVSEYFDTQAEAEKAAKEFSSNNGGGEVRIHGLDGKIRDSDTVPPGNDPNPPKDKVG